MKAGFVALIAIVSSSPVFSSPVWAAPLALRNPVAAECISSPFGWRHAVGPHAPAGQHNGVDLPAPAGAMVFAAAPGHVLWVRRMGIGGLQVMVAHQAGVQTLYAHLGSVTPALATGRRDVAAGTPLGRIGRTGITYGTHLYFEVLRDGSPIDPAPLLALPACGGLHTESPPGPGPSPRYRQPVE